MWLFSILLQPVCRRAPAALPPPAQLDSAPQRAPPPLGRQSPNSAQHKSRSQGQRFESIRAGANPPRVLSARAWNRVAGYPEFFSGFAGSKSR